ncbi:MAG TPA: hypothetical protein ENG07_00730 [Candidatus Bathyarchaeota archaeon]|nr:hypothetical protein [Candidatus Bathyarchaeota archaeon]
MQKCGFDHEDFLHLSTAIRAGAKEMISNDKDFDKNTPKEVSTLTLNYKRGLRKHLLRRIMPLDKRAIEKIVFETGKGVTFKVYVTPRAPQTKLVYKDGEFLFYSEKDPKRHAVNRDLIRFLGRIFGDVSIVRGELDRLKLIEVRGLSREEVISRLLRAVDKRS